MVLHIESYLSRRKEARLEARPRAADIGVGLAPINRIPTGNSIKAIVIAFGLREILHGRAIRKDQSGCVPALFGTI